MGKSVSMIPIAPEHLNTLRSTTNYTRGEIEHLHNRFNELLAGSGRKRYIVRSDFGYPTFSFRMLLVNEMFGSKFRIDFLEFSTFLHMFKVLDLKATATEREQSKKKKLKLMFNMYDCDKSGDISKNDLLDVIHVLFSHEDMRSMYGMVNVIMKEMDVSNVNRISFDDFCLALQPFDMDHLAIKFPSA